MANSSVDWSDPCAALDALRNVKYQILMGSRKVSLRLDDRAVDYGNADVGAIDAEILRLEAACANAQGKPSKRYAIRAGSFAWRWWG